VIQNAPAIPTNSPAKTRQISAATSQEPCARLLDQPREAPRDANCDLSMGRRVDNRRPPSRPPPRKVFSEFHVRPQRPALALARSRRTGRGRGPDGAGALFCKGLERTSRVTTRARSASAGNHQPVEPALRKCGHPADFTFIVQREVERSAFGAKRTWAASSLSSAPLLTQLQPR